MDSYLECRFVAAGVPSRRRIAREDELQLLRHHGIGRPRLDRLRDLTATWLARERETAPGIWLEKQVFLIRWLGIAAVIPPLLLLPLPSSERLPLLGIVAFAVGYNGIVPWLIRHRPDRAMPMTTSGDTLAAGLFLLIAGFDTELYLVLFTIVVAVSMRLGLRPALLVVAFFVTLDLGSGLARGNVPLVSLAFRASFLAVVAILSATLYQYAKRGEDVLRRLNAQLQEANRELRQVDEIKSAFISNVSHELRTPLTSIRSYSELLLTYDDPAVTREFAEIINGQSERLTRLVNDGLDIMKIEEGEMEWRVEPVDVSRLLHQAARVYTPLIAQQDVTLRLVVDASLPWVDGDPDRLQQVVSNLLSNAWKFTTRGTIQLRAVQVGDEIHVSVADTGIGIAPEDQRRIFERFQQVGALLTDKPAGTGLGLAICREIVEHHGGRIWVESEPGVGSRFSFSLGTSGTTPRRGESTTWDELEEDGRPSHQSAPPGPHDRLRASAALVG